VRWVHLTTLLSILRSCSRLPSFGCFFALPINLRRVGSLASSLVIQMRPCTDATDLECFITSSFLFGFGLGSCCVRATTIVDSDSSSTVLRDCLCDRMTTDRDYQCRAGGAVRFGSSAQTAEEHNHNDTSPLQQLVASCPQRRRKKE
jgi:hypothetical protein